MLCAHLSAVEPRFAIVGRQAEDQQYRCKVALDAAGFDLTVPNERTARIFGRVYQLPDVTASVVRELINHTPVVLPPPVHDVGMVADKEDRMQTTITDPNAKLNGPEPACENGGALAFIKRQCTVRNGVIAGAVVLIGTALYFALTSGGEGDVPAVSATA